MRIGILGFYRTLDDLISYVPKAGCGKRQMKVFRSKTVLDNSKVKPLVMCDTEFWNERGYPQIIEALVAAESRDWTTPQTAGTKTKVSKGVSSAKWKSIRGKAYEDAEMVGAILVRLAYDESSDYIVSAAPNLLFNTKSKKYKVHPNTGDNDGTQLHSEVLMGEQLLALIDAMKGASETNPLTNKSRGGLSAGDLTIDIDIFIEKQEMCGGCKGMWKDRMSATTYRVV
ncbi:MAG TPA: hypothetical protein VMG10_18760 [Gemmataceae bacterium]|nr:hypothetical protein [Gemmataceae bacterium]